MTNHNQSPPEMSDHLPPTSNLVRSSSEISNPTPKRDKHQNLLDKTSIALYIGKYEDPLIIQFTQRITFGRFGASSSSQPAIDLTPYGAFDMGVSRLHAAIFRNETDLIFEDIGSVNGSFINGVRVPQHSRPKLISGDIIKLGDLKLEIYFNQSSEGASSASHAGLMLSPNPLAPTISGPLPNADIAKTGPTKTEPGIGLATLHTVKGTVHLGPDAPDQQLELKSEMTIHLKQSSANGQPSTLEIAITCNNLTSEELKRLLDRAERVQINEFDLKIK